MRLEFEAVYENGVLKPDRPLPLKDQERVRLNVEQALSHARQSSGVVAPQGDPALVDLLAMDPEMDLEESP